MSYPKPLHWWVDNVLPLVYDGSLSYYEVMSKVTEYINGLTGDMTEVKSQIENIDAIIETLDPERIETLLSEVDRLATAVGGMEGRVGTLETDNTTNKSDISELKTDVNQLESNVSTLGTNVDNFGNRLGNVEEQVSGYNERITNAENLARTANTNTAALGERVSAAEEKVNNVEDKADNYSKAIAKSEEWFTATRSYAIHDLVFVGSTLYEVISDIASGDSLTIGSNIKAVTISENNKEIKDAINEIENNLESLNSDVNDLKNNVTQNIENLETETNKLNSALDDIENGGYIEQTVTYTDGGYIADYSPGAVKPFSGWKYTDYINISDTKNGKILIKMYSTSGAETTDGNAYNAWYDANKNYVEKLRITNSYLDVPDNAVYIRLSCRSAFTQKLSFYYNGTHDIINTDAIDGDYINFVTWNVGIFKDGTNKPTTEEAPAQIVAIKKMVGDKNPNFLNAQEYVDMVDAANTISSANLMKFKLPYKTSVATNKCFSKLEILNAETITFTSGSDRYCKAYEVKLNNKAVTIINAHLSIERDPSTYRNADIQQLITYMQTKEYVILSGDFNVASDAEYTPFTTSGFVLCNGGDFGWFNTWPVMENMWEEFIPDWPCNHLDNIIVSSNIVPQYVEAVTCSVSDHAPLFAILRID